MFTLPLASRLARSFSGLTRSLRRPRSTITTVRLDDHLRKDIGLPKGPVDPMRRMW